MYSGDFSGVLQYTSDIFTKLCGLISTSQNLTSSKQNKKDNNINEINEFLVYLGQKKQVKGVSGQEFYFFD